MSASALVERLVRGALRGARRGERVVELLEALHVALGLEPEPPDAAGADEAGLSKNAKRMREYRASRKTNGRAHGDERVRTPDDENERVRTRAHDRALGGKGGDLSTPSQTESSLGDSEDFGERESETRVRTDVANVRAHAFARPPLETVVTLDLPLPDELRRLADMRMVQDIDGAWGKFCGYYNGRAVDLAGRWQSWCIREAKSERIERDRAARRGPAPAAERDPEQEQREGRAARERAEATVAQRMRELGPQPAPAIDVDQAQRQRARAASRRPPADVTDLGGRKAVPRSMTPQELEAERQRQLAGLEELQKAGGS